MARQKIALPSISVIIPTYNSASILARCLSDIRRQDYPQQRVEIIIADGGSTDTTLDIARGFDTKVITVPPQYQNAEYNRGIAFNHAQHELVLVLDHDNFLPTAHWLRQMVKPLMEHPEIVAVESCRYHYQRSYSLLDRYFALWGAGEPLPYFLHKQDRLRQTSVKWDLAGTSRDAGQYYIVDFSPDPRCFPTIGSNGCLMRRQILLDHADVRPDHHYPIDVMVDVLLAGHTRFAFVKNSLIHLTGHAGVITFLLRRYRFVRDYHFQHHSRRRYSVVMPGDGPRVFLFALYSFTLIGPIWDSLINFISLPDPAWFVHVPMCWGTAVIYSFPTVRQWLKRF